MKYLVIGTGRIVKYFILAIQKIDPKAHFLFKPESKIADISVTKLAKDREYVHHYSDIVSDKIDLAYVATPGNSHLQNTLDLINRGVKLIVVEKPICEYLADLEVIFSAARKKGVHVFEGIKTIFHPNHKEVKKLIKKGTMGKIIGGEIIFSRLSTGEAKLRFSKKMVKGTFHQHFGYFYSFINDLFGWVKIDDFLYKTNEENDYLFQGKVKTKIGNILFSSDRSKENSDNKWYLLFENGRIDFTNSVWEFAYGGKTSIRTSAGYGVIERSNSTIGLEFEMSAIIENINNKHFFAQNNKQSAAILKIYKKYYQLESIEQEE